MELVTKNVERNNGAMILLSGVMRKRTIDSFSSLRPVPGVQKRSECFFQFAIDQYDSVLKFIVK